jgi:phosphohistidine phosphatase
MKARMKTILILRHAKAESPAGCPDIERPLAEKGEKDARRIGEFLKEAEILPDIVLCSKARRAMQTAEIAASTMGIPPEKLVAESRLYSADTADLLAFMDNLDDAADMAMIVGHNPGLENCVSELMNGATFAMSTASLACFEAEMESWRQFRKSCILRFFLHPKLVKKLV